MYKRFWHILGDDISSLSPAAPTTPTDRAARLYLAMHEESFPDAAEGTTSTHITESVPEPYKRTYSSPVALSSSRGLAMIDHQRRYLACLCGLTAREANKHTNDYHYIGMEKGLSVFATNAAVAICRFGGQQDKAKLAIVSAARQQWKYLPAMGRMALTSAYPAACDASVYDAVSRHADFRSFRVGCERRTLDALSDYFHAMQRSL